MYVPDRARALEADGPHWRPVDNGDPVLWDDFYAATHPPIPKGWEKDGEWEALRNAIEDGKTSLCYVGDGEEGGVFNSGDGYIAKVRRVQPVLPAVPDGWEAVGEWFNVSPHEIYPMAITSGYTLLSAAGTFHDGACGPGWFCVVRRVPSPVDWGDVPKGVELTPLPPGNQAGGMSVFQFGESRGHVMKGGGFGWWSVEDGVATLHVSLPAAIVALTGRME